MEEEGLPLLLGPATFSATRGKVRLGAFLGLTGTCHTPGGATLSGTTTAGAVAAGINTVNDPGFFRIVGRHLDADIVTGHKADESFAHLARNVGENEVAVLQFHPEHGSRQNGVNRSFQFYCFVVFLHNRDFAVSKIA